MILVTGGTGLVGSHLLQALAQQQMPIRAIKRPNSILPNSLLSYANQIEWIEADLTDYFAIEKAMQGCSHIYHCAAMVSFDPKDKKIIDQINVQGTANIVNAALFLGITKMIFVSSIAALGEAKPGMLIDENCHWTYDIQASDYSISKFESEREVWRGITEGLNAVIVNPSVILGFDEKPGGAMSLIHMVNSKFYFYPTGKIALVFVIDLCDAMIALMKSDISGERYIVSSENMTYKEFFALIASVYQYNPIAIKISNGMSNLLIIFIQLYSLFAIKRPLLSKFSLRASQKNHIFNNQKLIQAIGFKYTSIKDTLALIKEKKG